MPNITLKNIPENLYDKLRQLAGVNHRSINSEIIVCIERAVLGQKVDVETIIADVRRLRDRIGTLPITDEEFTEAKRAGRP